METNKIKFLKKRDGSLNETTTHILISIKDLCFLLIHFFGLFCFVPALDAVNIDLQLLLLYKCISLDNFSLSVSLLTNLPYSYHIYVYTGVKKKYDNKSVQMSILKAIFLQEMYELN